MSPGRVVGSSPPLAFEYGDVLVLLTDGITEAKSPEGVEFGSEGFLGVMGTHGKAAAQVILDGLHSAVRGFSSGTPQRDDMTIVVCKCLPREDTASLPAASGP
jgi:serine phosphatase RsbU (regulator of sigma subunit)